MPTLNRPIVIQVEPEGTRYAPGDPVRAAIRLEAHGKVLIERGILELACVGYYAFPPGEYGTAGPFVHFRETWTFVGQASMSAGERRTFSTQLVIPDDALPSFRGTNITIQWELRARLDGRGLRTWVDRPLLTKVTPSRKYRLLTEPQ
jgi:hypothetical protein